MTKPYTLHLGDCLEVLRTMPDNSVDSIVTDPPYGLSAEPDMAEVLRHWLAGDDYQHKGSGFMGKTWDSFVPGPAVWREALRVLKPGGHLLAFFGSRTYDIGTLAIRLAGFEIRDQAFWVYGSGFPKSQNISKAIDKQAGAEREVVSEGKAVKRMIPGADQDATGSWIKDNGREYVPQVTRAATPEAEQWEGWGTALKPAHEPICVARKPLEKGLTVAANVLKWGAGAINIDGCRVEVTDAAYARNCSGDRGHGGTRGIDQEGSTNLHTGGGSAAGGRWPANLIHDGSAAVVALFPAQAGASAPVRGTEASAASVGRVTGERERVAGVFHDDSGSAARFFYCAKASRTDRNEGLVSSDMPVVAKGATMREQEDADWPARNGNHHPTVKPTDLMAYLCRLVTPPRGKVLDLYMGSGSTGKACMREGFEFEGIDMTPEYVDIARVRIEHELVTVTAAREAAARAAAEEAAKPVQLSLLG